MLPRCTAARAGLRMPARPHRNHLVAEAAQTAPRNEHLTPPGRACSGAHGMSNRIEASCGGSAAASLASERSDAPSDGIDDDDFPSTSRRDSRMQAGASAKKGCLVAHLEAETARRPSPGRRSRQTGSSATIATGPSLLVPLGGQQQVDPSPSAGKDQAQAAKKKQRKAGRSVVSVRRACSLSQAFESRRVSLGGP